MPSPSGPADDDPICRVERGCARRTALQAGGVLVELVEHLDPVGRARPDDHRISDQGILNIAFGERNSQDHLSLYHRALGAGAKPNRSPVRLPGGGVVYVTDPDGFSVELLWLSPKQDRFWGFTARPTGRRIDSAPQTVEQTVRIAASATETWAVLTNPDTMSDWLPVATVERVVDGVPDRDGRGSQRRLTFPGWSIVEEVVESGRRAPTAIERPAERRSPATTERSPCERWRGHRAHLANPIPSQGARDRPAAGARALVAPRPRTSVRSQGPSGTAPARNPSTTPTRRNVIVMAKAKSPDRTVMAFGLLTVAMYLTAIALLPMHAPDSSATGAEVTVYAASHRSQLLASYLILALGLAVLLALRRRAASHHPTRRTRGRLARDGIGGERGRRGRDLRRRYCVVHGRRLPAGRRSGSGSAFWDAGWLAYNIAGFGFVAWIAVITVATFRYGALPRWSAWIAIPIGVINFIGPFAVQAGAGAFSPQGWFAMVVALTFAVWLLADRGRGRGGPARPPLDDVNGRGSPQSGDARRDNLGGRFLRSSATPLEADALVASRALRQMVKGAGWPRPDVAPAQAAMHRGWLVRVRRG